MQITFTINGEKQLSRNLRLTAVNLKNMGEFYRAALEIVHDRSNEIFKGEGNNVEKNNKWNSLKPKTLVARSRKWGYYKNPSSSPKTLRWTGRLQDNVRKDITSTSGVLQYMQPYAIYHQEGGGNLPRRAIIDLSNDTNNKIIKALQKKINDDTKIFGKQI